MFSVALAYIMKQKCHACRMNLLLVVWVIVVRTLLLAQSQNLSNDVVKG